MIVCLDLDETLVRVSCNGVHKRELDHVDFHINVNVGGEKDVQTFECAVAKRPGLDSFLDWLRDRVKAGLIESPWVFTTATPAFSKALMKHLDPGGTLIGLRVLTRQYCEMPALPGFFLKDLSKIPPQTKPNYARKVLIDNSPISHVLNPGNAVLVRDYVANNPGDNELARVADMLDGVIQAHNDNFSGSAGEDGDYASYLSRVPGHDQFRERLQALHKTLTTPGPEEVNALRAALRAASAECNDMKREYLGAAP